MKSPQGVQFRRWATQRLRDYLIKGYTINQQRFEENATELKQALALIQKAAKSPALATDMGRGLVDIMGRYTQTFLWLQQYDEGLLKEPGGRPGGTLPTPKSAMTSIFELILWHDRILASHRSGGSKDLAINHPSSKK